jgi:16S rRNA (cytidine1402-2'-O)-methyltransferase
VKSRPLFQIGTPLISDPGNLLIRKAVECGIAYTTVPGANAVLPALILSGFEVDNFLFIGFLPKKKSERDNILQTVAQSSYPCVLYASPHELKTLLKSISDRMPLRALSISKELTKIHEKTVRGTAAELYESCEEENKGEFTLVVSACEDQIAVRQTYSDDELHAQYMAMLRDCKTPGAALKKVAKITGIPKNELYAKLKIKDS